MSQVLTNLLAEVDNLNSLDELITLQERITYRMRSIATPNDNGNAHASIPAEPESRDKSSAEPESKEARSTRRVIIPGAYRRTKEQADAFSAHLKSKLPPEKQHLFGNRDFSHLVFEGKSTSELLIEDREDRF